MEITQYLCLWKIIKTVYIGKARFTVIIYSRFFYDLQS